MKKVLEQDQELSILSCKTPVSFTITRGRCGMKGVLLQPKQKYTFNAPFFIYATEKSEIQLRSRCDAKIKNTNQYYSKNLLNRKFHGTETIVIVGDTDTGKSTLTEILLNMVNPKQHNILDFDVGQNIFLPGTVAMKIMENSKQKDLVPFFFGHPSPAPNMKYYVHLVREMKKLIPEKSGSVINTCGWIRGKGLHAICNMIEALTPTILIIIENEKVVERLTRQFGHRGIDIWHFPKNPNVRKRNRTYRKNTRIQQIREYFIGTPQRKLKPYMIKKNFSDLCVVVIGFPDRQMKKQAFSLLDGFKSSNNLYGDMMIQKVNLEILDRKFSQNSVLGVSTATEPDEILGSRMMGLVYIKDINFKNKSVTLVAPGRDLNAKYLILGSVNYQ